MNVERARLDVLAIFRRVMRDVEPEALARRAVMPSDAGIIVGGVPHELHPAGKVVLLGVGKSASGMARGVESALSERLDHGLVVIKRGLAPAQQGSGRIEVVESSHPVPDKSSVTGGKRLLGEASRLSETDLVICVISGGGSALIEAPVDGVTLDDLKLATSVLLNAGADIWTLNAVRRRLSRIKAGGLARAISPARVVNLILSDVLGNPLSVIASGPTIHEDVDDQWRIDDLKTGPAWHSLPDAVRVRLDQPLEPTTHDSDNVVQSLVIGDASTAATAAMAAATEMGYRTFLLGSEFAGDARQFGRFWGQFARAAAAGQTSLPPSCCLVAAGEMTVNVRGDGRGGRNTEMAASAAFEIAGVPNVAVASLATDGDDGSSGSAGGVVVGESLEAVRSRDDDPRLLLESNDTRAFLEAAGGLIVTGLTGTNVNDLYLTLVDDGSPN